MTPTTSIDSTANTASRPPTASTIDKRKQMCDYQRTRRLRFNTSVKSPNKCIDCITRAYCPDWEEHKKSCESHRKELTKPLHDVSVDYAQGHPLINQSALSIITTTHYPQIGR